MRTPGCYECVTKRASTGLSVPTNQMVYIFRVFSTVSGFRGERFSTHL